MIFPQYKKTWEATGQGMPLNLTKILQISTDIFLKDYL